MLDVHQRRRAPLPRQQAFEDVGRGRQPSVDGRAPDGVRRSPRRFRRAGADRRVRVVGERAADRIDERGWKYAERVECGKPYVRFTLTIERDRDERIFRQFDEVAGIVKLWRPFHLERIKTDRYRNLAVKRIEEIAEASSDLAATLRKLKK